MVLPGAGQRYYFIPALAFITALVWAISRQSSPRLKKIAKIVLAVMLIGIISDYSLFSFPDFNFKESVKQFEQAPQGNEVVIPTPPSPDWSMTLKKR
jgi:C4-dicarboxylate transporter